MIKHFEELDEHYNGTMIQIHSLSFSTDVSSNEVFTYKEAMNQEDAHLFIEAIKKWHAMNRKIIGLQSLAQQLPKQLNQFKLFSHFNESDAQIVHLSSIKQDCVLMAECNNGKQITGRHIHQ